MDLKRDLPSTSNTKRIDQESLELARGPLALAWALLRFPLLLALVFLMRHQIIAAIFSIFGIRRPTLFAINILSTPVSRAIYFLVLVTLLLLCVVVTKRLSLSIAYLLILFAGFILIVATFSVTSRSLLFAVPALCLLATNLAPANLNPRVPSGVLSRCFMIGGIGFSELFLFWRHVRWTVWLAKGKVPIDNSIMPRWLWALPGIVLASAASATLFNGTAVVPLEQAIRTPAVVRTVARDDFNWIKSDPTQHVLYAVGHGLDHIRQYNVLDWSSQPIESEASTGGAQSFAYDPSMKELYVYDGPSEKLLYFDAQTLGLKRSIDIRDVSPGDTWLAFDDRTGTISISSEADEEIGTPFIVVDRSAGTIVDRQNEAAGSLLLDPNKSVEYLNFFPRKRGVEIYDLQKRTIIRRESIGAHADRMAIWEQKNELLITMPMESRVARLDADTLKSKGEFPTVFGVRAIAIDRAENLLFCGSIATGELDIIELPSGKRRAHYYLGPWLRTIELLPDRGVAYISSNGAMYEVRYK